MPSEDLDRRIAGLRLLEALRELRGIEETRGTHLERLISRNEVEGALDEMEVLGEGAGETFWRRLQEAAKAIGLPERARLFGDHAFARQRAADGDGWPIPKTLRHESDWLQVFPWPGRDEALVLFDIEDYGPAGPAAGTLALLRRKEAPEIAWQGGPVFLDEYWLGTSHSVAFSEGGEYAFARPYLRGRYASSFLVLIRPSDPPCTILDTSFCVYRIEAVASGCFCAHATPDPRMPPVLPDRGLDHAASWMFREADLDWFDASELWERISRIPRPESPSSVRGDGD